MRTLILAALLVACGPEFEEDDMAYSGWSASKTIDAASGDSIQLQANFTEPGPYSVQFTVDYPGTWGITFSCIAQIDWKVEGNWVSRIVSVTNGTTVSGTSQAVKVTLTDTSSRFVPGVTANYLATMQVAPGTRPQTTRGPIYQPNTPLLIPAGGAPVLVQVPSAAGATSVMVIPELTFPAGKLFVQEIVDPVFNYEWDPTVERDWHIIAAGVTRIDIVNTDVNDTYVQVVYGIDG